MGQIEEDASYVVRSPNRTIVLRRLNKGAAIPAQIKEDTGLEYSRISEATNDLRSQKLIDLLVDDDTKRGRLYSITERGEETLNFMQKNGMLDSDDRYGRK